MVEIEHIQEVLSQHGYEYKGFLGKGGFSSVLLCESKKYNQFFAVKRSVKHQITEDEYNHLVNLNHANIIRLYDYFHDESSHYLVMEYCPNGTMQQKGKLPYDKFIYYAKEILEAIAFCHSHNIAHRDLKPENIFIDQYDHVKLADFGIAKQFEYDEKSSEKCGSLMFVAPELLQYHETNPFKGDIWSLGITFFYMATGKFPFRNTSQEELRQNVFRGEIEYIRFDIHPKIRFLVNKMCTKDQNNRPTAEKLLSLPMFSDMNAKPSILVSKSSQKLGLTKFQVQSKSHLSPHTPLQPEMPNGERNDKKMKRMANVRSYKSLNLYPQLQRMNSRVGPLNTF